jgi:hypothetical protein
MKSKPQGLEKKTLPYKPRLGKRPSPLGKKVSPQRGQKTK